MFKNDARLVRLQGVCPRLEHQRLKTTLLHANLTCCVPARLLTLVDAESGLLSVLATSGLASFWLLLA